MSSAREQRFRLPRVCFIGTHPGVPRLLCGAGPDAVGGAELQLVMVARALRARGYRIAFGVGAYDGVTDGTTPDGIELVTLYRRRHHAERILKALRPVELWGALRRIDADVYFTKGASAQTGVLGTFCALTGKHLVVWLASDIDVEAQPYEGGRVCRSHGLFGAAGLKAADLIIAQTTQQEVPIMKRFGRDVAVVPNIWSGSVGASGRDEDYALWVSNIRPEKRPEMLVDLARALPDTRFVMIGGQVRGHEDLYRSIEREAAGLSNLEFVGYVPFEQTHDYFARARLLVNTSAIEGFPNTYLQAWSAGKPVVASFDPDDTIRDRELGAVFTDLEGAQETIRAMWSDGQRRRDIGERATAYVREKHSEEAVLQKLCSLLDRLTAPGDRYVGD